MLSGDILMCLRSSALGPSKTSSLIDCVDGFLDLLADPRTDFRVKLTSYGKLRDDVFEFCRFYARWLGNPLMEMLKYEVYQLLEKAIDWWGQQDILDLMEVGWW
jgi:hypothetical protein